AGHRGEELAEARGVGVERVERVATGLGLVLRVAGAEGLGQRAPERVEAGVGHLEDAADVAGRVAVGEASGLRRVAAGVVGGARRGGGSGQRAASGLSVLAERVAARRARVRHAGGAEIPGGGRRGAPAALWGETPGKAALARPAVAF